jgi:hypothetical protein
MGAGGGGGVPAQPTDFATKAMGVLASRLMVTVADVIGQAKSDARTSHDAREKGERVDLAIPEMRALRATIAVDSSFRPHSARASKATWSRSRDSPRDTSPGAVPTEEWWNGLRGGGGRFGSQRVDAQRISPLAPHHPPPAQADSQLVRMDAAAARAAFTSACTDTHQRSNCTDRPHHPPPAVQRPPPLTCGIVGRRGEHLATVRPRRDEQGTVVRVRVGVRQHAEGMPRVHAAVGEQDLGPADALHTPHRTQPRRWGTVDSPPPPPQWPSPSPGRPGSRW